MLLSTSTEIRTQKKLGTDLKVAACWPPLLLLSLILLPRAWNSAPLRSGRRPTFDTAA